MLSLYNKDFATQYGTISNVVEAFVEEERNGLFELRFVCLNTDSLLNYIEKGNIVVCNANDTLLNQKFRIYMTRKMMNNRVEVYARHISFDLMYDYIDKVEFSNQSCEYALNELFRNSNFSNSYKGYSDIINAQDYSIKEANILEAIGGKEGSILDTFGTGAELLRDNENIHVLNRRGWDNEVTIEYRKNLTGFELEEDITDLVTRILPYAKYNDENNNEVVVKGSYVDSPFIGNYSHPYIKAIDYSDKFEGETIPTIANLKTLAENEYKTNKVDIPKQNFKIEFTPLSKTVGYEAVNDNISLCDTVTIVDTRYNIDTQSKVIKVVFDVLKNRYESMELGEPRTSLGDIINSGNSDNVTEDDVKDMINGIKPTYPNTLPPRSALSGNSIGLATIELNWTYENKVYYSYEVYASKTKDFTPNAFDLIFEGQASSFLYQAKPNETWYFRVCAINTHGNRNEFSEQLEISTTKIDANDWIESATIGNALIGDLSADKITAGTIKGHLIDARNLTVTDSNGKRTLDIDSFGSVNLDVASLKISSKGVPTIDGVIKPGEAIADINVTPGTVKIQSNKIQLEGTITTGSNGNYVQVDDFTYSAFVKHQRSIGIGAYQEGSVFVPHFMMSDTNIYAAASNVFAMKAYGNAQHLAYRRKLDQAWSVFEMNDAGNFVLTPANKSIFNKDVDFNNSIHMQGSNLDVRNSDGSIAGRFNYQGLTTNQISNISGGTINIQGNLRSMYSSQNLGSADGRWQKLYCVTSPDISSDSRFKEDVRYINAEINTLAENDEVTVNDMYDFVKNDLHIAEYKYINQENSTFGFIAQDIKDTKVGAKFVHEDANSYLSYDSGAYINVLASALQKAIVKIEQLEIEIRTMKEGGANA